MEYNTKLMIIKALRAHSGLYTIKAKNSVGEDTATFDITILGKKKYYKFNITVYNFKKIKIFQYKH